MYNVNHFNLRHIIFARNDYLPVFEVKIVGASQVLIFRCNQNVYKVWPGQLPRCPRQ